MGILLDSFLIETFLLVLTIIGFFYFRFRLSSSKFWSEKNIEHLPPVFILGNGINKLNKVSPGQVHADYYKAYKEKKALGYWMLTQPVLGVFDLEIIKNILVRDFSHFTDRIQGSQFDHDPLTGNLFNLDGHKWRNMRVKLTPTFTSGKIKMMYETILQCCKELQEYLVDTTKNDDVIELNEVLSKFTINVIASCAFGIQANALKDPNNEFYNKGKKINEVPVSQLITNIACVTYPSIGRLFKLRQFPKDVTNFFMKVVREVFEYRKINKVKGNDFMQLMIELNEKGKIEDVDKSENTADDSGDTPFTIDDAAAQAFVFYVGGFDTSSKTMSFTLYELVKNLEIQHKLAAEIRNAVKETGGTLPYDVVMKLPYLNCVVEETLRKYPVVPFLIRMVTKEYDFKEFNCILPKKTLIFIPLLGIARDPDYFPDPEKFDPDRFLPENINARPLPSCFPFGEGPRSCIGNRFGLLQTKIGLATILSQYDVEICDKTPDTITFNPKSFVLAADGGIHVRLKKVL